jgi:hypothetical protein
LATIKLRDRDAIIAADNIIFRVYELYGQLGLIALAILAFLVLLGCVWFLKYAKTRINQGERSRLNRGTFVVAVILFFFGEAYLTGIIVRNFLVLLLLPFVTLLAIQYGVTLAYFVFMIFFTRIELKWLIYANRRKRGLETNSKNFL